MFHQHPKWLTLDTIPKSLWYQQRPSASSNTEHFDQSLNLDFCDIFIKDKTDPVS